MQSTKQRPFLPRQSMPANVSLQFANRINSVELEAVICRVGEGGEGGGGKGLFPLTDAEQNTCVFNGNGAAK
jgi:hypothetical protein